MPSDVAIASCFAFGDHASAVTQAGNFVPAVNRAAITSTCWLVATSQITTSPFVSAIASRLPFGLAAMMAAFAGSDVSSRSRRLGVSESLRGISVTDVTNWLHVARREFRQVALDLLRELTASEEEFDQEALAVFGIDTRAAD